MSRKSRANPGMLSNVLHAVAHLQDAKGSTVKQILLQVQTAINISNLKPKPRNIVTQVRKALRHAVETGILKMTAGKYKFALGQGNPSTSTNKKGKKNHRTRLHNKKKVEVDEDDKSDSRCRKSDRRKKQRLQRRRKPCRKRSHSDSPTSTNTCCSTCYDTSSTCYDTSSTCYDTSSTCYDTSSTCYDTSSTCYDTSSTCYDTSSTCYDTSSVSTYIDSDDDYIRRRSSGRKRSHKKNVQIRKPKRRRGRKRKRTVKRPSTPIPLLPDKSIGGLVDDTPSSNSKIPQNDYVQQSLPDLPQESCMEVMEPLEIQPECDNPDCPCNPEQEPFNDDHYDDINDSQLM